MQADRYVQPTSKKNRLLIIDALRGFALLGILAANMRDFHSPIYYIQLEQLWPGILDKLSEWFIFIFVGGKFFTLYSFLFGLGLSLQMDRLEARGVRFIPVYLRRQTILLFIGILHGVFIWYGDILAPYAVYGCILMLFRNRSPRFLVLVSVFLLLAPITLSTVRTLQSDHAVNPNAFSDLSDDNAANERNAKEVIQIYSKGTFGEILNQRTDELMINYNGWFKRNFGISLFTMFLLGLYAGRRHIFDDIKSNLPLVKKLWVVGFSFLLLSIALFVTIKSMESNVPFWLSVFSYQFEKVSRIAISLFYVSTLVLLFQRPAWQKLLAALAEPGRMGLTNYLLQSVVCTTIFNSYGLGLFGQVSPSLSLVLTGLFFVMQMVLSRWYLKHFSFGPMEWLWKSLTYWKWQSIRSVGA